MVSEIVRASFCVFTVEMRDLLRFSNCRTQKSFSRTLWRRVSLMPRGVEAAGLWSTVRGLLGVMMSTAAARLRLGPVPAAAAAGRGGTGARSSQRGDGRRRLGVAGGKHERRRKTFPVDRVVRLEPDDQLATG